METQNIEYKENWRDEYIKWICGFCNANGGKIYIGINDKGVVTGVEDIKKLLEEIPNKTKDILGIIVDVNLKTKYKKNYLEIVVDPYPCPISYKGEYHYRSGSTKQQLKGAALDKFILQKQGKHWDGVPQPNLSLKDFAKSAFDYFKYKSAQAGRLAPEELKYSSEVVLQKLLLTTDTNYYKRAAALLFHPNAEKFFTGAYIKIGFFRTDDDLSYQDEIHGTLFEQVEKTIDLLRTKYLIASISYHGIHRTEKFPLPESALREAILNAVIHKDYDCKIPIQISVYSNKMIIWNGGQLPENWTVDRLRSKHPSVPYNPDIANCFFRAGLIEAWGRGTIKIINDCKKHKNVVASFKYDLSGFIIEFKFKGNGVIEFNAADTENSIGEKIINIMMQDSNVTIGKLVQKINVSKTSIERHIQILRDSGRLKRIGSNKSGRWAVK